MFQRIKQISILNKIFNVHGNEWPRILLAWTTNFLYRIGFVIGWTIIIAFFVTRYGISALPYFFVLNAVLTIAGSLFYSLILDKFRKEKIMIFNILLAIALLVSAFFFSENQVLFLSLLIAAESIFLVHFRILFGGVVEDMFTPIQSERTFPLIEASETIGGITAGLLVTLLANSINIPHFILIWIGLLILIIPCVLIHYHLNNKIPVLKEKKAKKSDNSNHSLLKKWKDEFSVPAYAKYLQGLFVIVFLQWVIFNLLEFQYTKAVYVNVSDIVMDAGGGFEHAFVHDLGALFILFSASALLVQLFIGSRLINSLGVVGSMFLHALVTLFSVVGITIRFDFATAVLAKNNFTITSSIHNNAYHSSYYALQESLREHIREFLEGIVRPMGAVAGTMLIVFVQMFFTSSQQIFYVNAAMLVISIILVLVTYRQQKQYTEVALEGLVNKSDREARFVAIDILAQKGHRSSVDALLKILFDKNEPCSVKVRVLAALAELKDPIALKEVIKCLEQESAMVRKAVLNTLLSYGVFGTGNNESLVTEHDLIMSLQVMFRSEKDDDVRRKILTLLSKISTVATFEYLLKLLKTSRGRLKADIIYALGNYHDPAVAEFIRPYLTARDVGQRTSAIIALGRFPSFLEEILGIIASMLNSQKKKEIAQALFIVGELGLSKKRKMCLGYLESKDSIVKINAAIALAKLGAHESIPVLIDLLFSGDLETAKKVKSMLENIDPRILKNIDRIIRHLVSNEVEKILAETPVINSVQDLDHDKLLTLKWLYSLVEEYDEVEIINKTITI